VIIANLLMAFTSHGKLSMMQVFMGNYLMAALFSYFVLPPGNLSLPLFDLGFGLLSGVFFLLTFWILQRSIVVNGMSLSAGVARISVIIPILIAVIWFREGLTALNVLGIALGLTAFALKTNPKELRNLFWIIALFLFAGLTDASLKIYKELGSGAEPAFVFLIFCSAFALTLLVILLGKIPIDRKSLLLGCVLGIPNRFSTVFFLKGLDDVPAEIAYPVVAVGGLLLIIICDIAFWHKKATRFDLLLWFILLLSLVLLNLD